jgi:hypothetical protein
MFNFSEVHYSFKLNNFILSVENTEEVRVYCNLMILFYDVYYFIL